MDGKELPAAAAPASWLAGSVVGVGWAIAANHGGGYQWRLCKLGEGGDASGVDEACFQRTPLPFANGTQAIVWPDGRRKEAPLYLVTEGVSPAGAAWARGPVPGCATCEPYESCGEPLPPVAGFVKSDWDEQVNCNAMCDGAAESKGGAGACTSPTHFPPPAEGISGFGKAVWPWSIVDYVRLPDNLETGDYLLSWRWDCEESTQVWENCADVRITAAGDTDATWPLRPAAAADTGAPRRAAAAANH